MKRSQSILLTSVLVASIASFSFGWFFAKNIGVNSASSKNTTEASEKIDPAADTSLTIRDLQEVWQKLADTYYDASKLDLSKLEYGAVKGFTASVGDPYTVFMTPDESKNFEDGLSGLLEGIGAQLEVKQGKLIVVAPIKNSPAEKAGIKPGDIIEKIDDSRAAEMTLYEAIRKIRGKKGTFVVLTIIREGVNEPFNVQLLRDEITVDTITVKKLENAIYYVALNQFNDHTKTEFRNIIQQILLEKAKGMILDIRGNGGGYLDTAVYMISEFIPGEKTAVIIKKRDQTQNETVKTSGNPGLPDIPLVILVNKGSASASEILAGAIQDYKRGILIGETTFGKGSVQEINKLADGASLRVTIAKWFTPLERSIDEVGITPDQEVKFTEEDAKNNRDPQLEEAIKYLKKRRG